MKAAEKEQDITFKHLFVPLTTRKAIGFIIIVGVVVFCNGLFNGFVHDDRGQIVENLTIHSLQNFPAFFSGSTFYYGPGFKQAGLFYRPVVNTTFSLIYSFFGPNPHAFHFFQLILYLVNACLVFLLFKHFFNKPLALFLSLVFLVHPSNSEAVLYLGDMQEVLFFLFGCMALLLVEKYRSQKALILGSGLFFIALLAKETGILFILVTLLFVFLYNRKNILPLLGYSCLLFLFYALLRYNAGIGFNAGSVTAFGKLSIPLRLLNMPAIFFFYLKTFIFPSALSVSYQWLYTHIDLRHFYLPLAADLLFFAAASGASFWLYVKKQRKHFTIYLFFSFWFLTGILLHLQFSPLDATVANRWFYFPITGLLGMIGAFIDAFQWRSNRKLGMGIALCVLLLLSIRSYVRTFDWRTNLILSMHDIKVSKEAYDLELEISGEYYRAGRFKDTIIHAKKANELFPSMSGYNILGSAYFSLQDYKEAQIAYLQVPQYGNYYGVYENLAKLALVYGEPKENIAFIRGTALRKFPRDGVLWLCLASLEYNHGSKDEAKQAVEQAYGLDNSAVVRYAYEQIMQDRPYRLTIR